MKFIVYALSLSVVLLFACDKKEDKLPTVTTFPVTNISDQSACCGGIITGENIKAKGVCWSLQPLPTISSNKTIDGEGAEHFESLISGLSASTNYYARAYALNSAGTAYGPQMIFRTKNLPVLPTISTGPIQNLAQTSAVSGVVILTKGDVAIVKYGICWATNAHPTPEQSTKREMPFSLSSISIELDGLSASTTYYVRAYAQTANETIYGNELSLTTFGLPITDIDGNIYNSVKIGNQEWMTENLRVKHYRNGDEVPYLPDNSNWSLTTTGAYGVYNSSAGGLLYGLLYNFAAVNDSRLLAPAGWHVASEAEWTTLIDYLGGASAAAIKMRSAVYGVWPVNTQSPATNESSFTALPGGSRSNDGYYTLYGQSAYFWTTTNVTTQSFAAFAYYLDNYNLYPGAFQKSYGCSVRCIKD